MPYPLALAILPLAGGKCTFSLHPINRSCRELCIGACQSHRFLRCFAAADLTMKKWFWQRFLQRTCWIKRVVSWFLAHWLAAHLRSLWHPKQLGLKVDNSDERGSMIMGITEGVVEHFNLQNPERALSVYDRILTVDGEPTTITEVHRLRMSSLAKEGANSLKLLVSRPQVLTVTGQHLNA